MRKILYTIEQINRIMNDNNPCIFGAGNVAGAVVRYMSDSPGCIPRIYVTEIRKNPQNLLGIPVCSIKKFNEDDECGAMIVCTKESFHAELEKWLPKYCPLELFFVSDKLYGDIRRNIKGYDFDNYVSIRELHSGARHYRDSLLRFVPKPCLEYMVLNICDHCNLRCKGCDHFACIADPYFVPFDTIYHDLKRLSELFHNDYIMKMSVMGGEPLLHPDLLKILETVRKFFPYTKIRLTTNGLLLLNQPEEFWQTCRDNSITIVNTRYPVNLDFAGLQKKAEEKQVDFMFFEGTGGTSVRKLQKHVIDLTGSHDPVVSFADCHISNYGNFLMEGKMYSCPFSCQAYRIFNKKFGQNLRMTEKDYIDIYRAESMQDIVDFAARPKYFCRYCSGRTEDFDWERSKFDISEWVEKNED